MDLAADGLAAALADRYLLAEEIGGGASAVVYRARDLRHDRWVALKVLHSALGAALGAERFQREIRTQARLHHPHLLPLFDSGVAADRLYYTMPYVMEGSLRDRLRGAASGLPVDEVLRLAREVASALSYAHALGVIHRDLKPENILLTATGDALVSDFGIASALEEPADGSAGRLTESGLTLGTPAYMSPEQSAGDEPVDGRSDIYALGAVVFEALTGAPPITGPNARSIIARRLTEPAPSVRSLRADLPPAVERALARALARRPDDRFDTALEFADALEAKDATPGSLGDTDAVAPGRRFRRWGLAAVLATLVLVAALVIGRRAAPGGGIERGGRRPKVLVVLPFKNLGAPDDQYFADGLTEELTSRLGGLSDLRVISRTSADQYRASGKSLRLIGSELGAGYVLEGSVRWERTPAGAAGRVRVTPQLIAVDDDSHLWSQAYDAELTEVLGVQSRIAEQVTSALDVRLRATERTALARGGTRSAEAYDFYLRGLDDLSRSNQAPDLLAAAARFAQAVAADPSFAEGQARLARAHVQVYWHYYDHTEARLALARQALDAAISLAPDLPETHIAQGYFHYWGESDYDAALREFTTALQRQPGNAELLQAIGYVERRQGRWRESTAHFVEGLRYDPRSGIRNFDVGDNYFTLHLYREAEHYLDQAIALSPDWPNPYVYKAWMLVSSTGDVARARAVLGQSLTRVSVNRFAASMSAGDRISASLITADSTFWPMIDGLSLATFTGDPPRYHTLKAELARFRGDTAGERAHGDSTRMLVEPRVRGTDGQPRMLSVLALGLAHMGRYAEAIAAGEQAVAALPVSRDAVSGPYFQTALAQVYLYAGQPDRAVALLEPLLRIPSWVTPAGLRVDPIWAPLRSRANFRTLIDDR